MSVNMLLLEVKEVFYLSVYGDDRDEGLEIVTFVVLYIPFEM